MNSTRRMPIAMLAKLEDARRVTTGETARFGMPHEFYIACDRHGIGNCDAEPITLDALVKEATRLWLNTWITKPLDHVVAWGYGRKP